jgi:hypothetical protein
MRSKRRQVPARSHTPIIGDIVERIIDTVGASKGRKLTAASTGCKSSPKLAASSSKLICACRERRSETPTCQMKAITMALGEHDNTIASKTSRRQPRWYRAWWSPSPNDAANIERAFTYDLGRDPPVSRGAGDRVQSRPWVTVRVTSTQAPRTDVSDFECPGTQIPPSILGLCRGR